MDIFTHKLLKTFLISSFIFIACFVFHHFFLLFLPFGLAFCIAYLLQPIIYKLQQALKWRPTFIAIFSVTCFLVVHSYLGFILTHLLINEAIDLLQHIPHLLTSGKKIYDTYIIVKYETIQSFVPFLPNIQSIPIDSIVENVKIFILNQLDIILRQFVVLFSSFSYISVHLFIFIVALYLITIDFQRIVAFFKHTFPIRFVPTLQLFQHQMMKTIIRLCKAQLILSAVTAIISFIGLMIISFKQPLLFGFILFFIDIVPYIGVGVFFVPMMGYSFFVGDYFSTIGLAITYCIVIIFRQIIEPKVVGSSLGLHPLLVLFIFFIIFHFYGFYGFIFSPIIIIITASLIHAKIFQSLWHYIQSE